MEIIESQRIKRPETIAPKKSETIAVLRRQSVKQEDCSPIGVCIPWGQKRKEIVGNVENEEILRRVWQVNESLAHTFIWHCLVSF